VSRTHDQPWTGGPAQAPDRPSDDSVDDLRTCVTVSRRHDEDVRQRQILVRLDDGPTHTLMFGEACTVDVRPGTHVLRANNTLFWKRVPFVIEAGEHLEFAVVNRASKMTFSFLAVMGVAPLFLAIEKKAVT
jgi:hypothetical protein